jgi:hypothetical protein
MRSLSTEWQYMTVQLAFSYTSLLAWCWFRMSRNM